MDTGWTPPRPHPQDRGAYGTIRYGTVAYTVPKYQQRGYQYGTVRALGKYGTVPAFQIRVMPDWLRPIQRLYLTIIAIQRLGNREFKEQSGKHPDFGRSTALFNHFRYPTAREFCRVILLRLVDSEQSDKRRKRVKPVRFYGVPLLSIPSARTFRLIAQRDLESFGIQNHAALGLNNTFKKKQQAVSVP